MKLPRRVKEISRITGITKNQVKTYLYRRRRNAKLMMKEIMRYAPKLPLPLVDVEEKPVTTLGSSKQQFEYDYWSLEVYYCFRDMAGRERRVHVSDLELMHQFVMEGASYSGSTQCTSES